MSSLGGLGWSKGSTRGRRDWGSVFWVAAALVLSLAVSSACSRKELREERYPSGALKSRGYVKQDPEKNYVRQGPWTFQYDNGQRQMEITYEDGKAEGPKTTWYESGQKQKEGTYKDGKLDGQFTFWHENGQEQQEVTFRDDKREGLVTTWYENGQKKQEETYSAGQLEGPVTAWYENGQKKQESVAGKEDKWEGPFTTWYENGQKEMECNYKEGKRDGRYSTWYENGQKKMECTFKADKLEGHALMWYANGQKKADGTFKDGKTKGPYAEWHENGSRAKPGTLTESPAEPRVVTDNNETISLGKPTVKLSKNGMARVLVEAKNVTSKQVTCTLKATFLKGDSIVGTADGLLSDVSAGDTKTAELTSTDDVAGYDTLKVKTSTCF